ncbi:MAG: ABC transporter permease, partial [Candidatus Aminicenantes bacterium]
MKRTSPQKLAERILGILSSSKKAGILGDAEEEYHMILSEKGRFKADVWYVWQILKPIPFLIRMTLYWRFIMFKNYLKIAFRNIKRQKGYSFINITGLAVGMACCLFILFYVLYEFTYDTFHEDADRIYRVAMEFRAKDQPIKYAATTPPPVAPAILDNFAEVEYAVRITQVSGIVKHGEKQFFEDRIFYADQSFFNVFSFPIIKGNPETALKEPYTAVLTESIAEKYFGSEDPVGKTISINHRRDYKITGVVKDVPPNSHFSFNFLFSFAPIEESLQNASIGKLWFSHSYYTYIK